MKDILFFNDEHAWLSNFWPARVWLEDRVYSCVENAYQAAKSLPTQYNEFSYITPGQAKRLGRVLPVRKDWDAVKLTVMKRLLDQKFVAGSDLAERLKATDDCLLQEGNTWGDTFWGVYNGHGQNWLGKLLMAQRTFLNLI